MATTFGAEDTIDKVEQTATTFILSDKSGLPATTATVWVAGWINGGGAQFQVLDQTGAFSGTNPTSVPFYAVKDVGTVTLSAATNGNDRLLFVASPSQPAALTVQGGNAIQYTQYPYLNPPGVAAPGPFDVFEFGQNAQDDLTAVNGFGLNLSFSIAPLMAEMSSGEPREFGMMRTVTRETIGKAFAAFVKNETKALPTAAAFGALLYDAPIAPGAPTPPLVGGQYFAICDPNDLLCSLTENYTTTTDNPLATYWDSTLEAFFATNQYLSINLSADHAHPNIYSGTSSLQTNPTTGVASNAYTLSNGYNSYTYYMPLATGTTAPGLTGAQYVFQQAFGPLTPAGSAGDAGLLQDSIWEALCRGVAQSGVSNTPITKGESTTAWNAYEKWYAEGVVSHLYAKFLHCSTEHGTDFRKEERKPPLMYEGAAYGFSMDENPLGPYGGPNVPSKTIQNVPEGATVTIVIGPWAAEAL